MSSISTIQELEELTQGESDEFIYTQNEAIKISAHGGGEKHVYGQIGNKAEPFQTFPKVFQQTSSLKKKKYFNIIIYTIAFVSFLAFLAFFGYHYSQTNTSKGKDRDNLIASNSDRNIYSSNQAGDQKIQSFSIRNASDFNEESSTIPYVKPLANVDMDFKSDIVSEAEISNEKSKEKEKTSELTEKKRKWKMKGTGEIKEWSEKGNEG